MKRIFLHLIVAGLSLLPLTSDAVRAWQELGPASATFMDRAGNMGMVVDAVGNVYIGGHFKNASGKYYVAKWNGSTWAPLGNLNANDAVLTITTDSKGAVYSAGKFRNGAPRNNYFVSKWDGTSWKELSNDTSYLKANYYIRTITTDAAGNVYAAGSFTDSTSFNKGRSWVARWNGAKWEELGKIDPALNPTFQPIRSITCDPSGNLYAVGSFGDAAGNTLVLKWNGKTWQALAPIPNKQTTANIGALHAVVSDKSGNIYTTGQITNAGGTIYVAKWNGSTWTEIASPTSKLGVPSDRGVFSLAVTPNGSDVYAAGYTEKEPPMSLAYVAHWNGSFWSELGATPYPLNIGRPGGVFALGLDGTGNVYATGDFKNPADRTYVGKYANYPGLSVSAVGGDAGIQVSPVPNDGRFNITGPWSVSGSASAAIRISNMHGQIVYESAAQPAGSTLTVDISGQGALPEGIYQLQIAYAGRVYAQAVHIRVK